MASITKSKTIHKEWHAMHQVLCHSRFVYEICNLLRQDSDLYLDCMWYCHMLRNSDLLSAGVIELVTMRDAMHVWQRIPSRSINEYKKHTIQEGMHLAL